VKKFTILIKVTCFNLSTYIYYFLENIMGKEFDAIEMIADVVEPTVTQLNELSLAMIGGGTGTVTF